MFGSQFYPTPQTLVREMVTGLDLNHKRILDPQAGRGDILDYIKDLTKYGYGHSHDSELYAIEKDSDLRQVLAGKGYKVIDSDFLTYTGQMYFDYILMNPPFKEGAKHLLKAWDVSRGAIIKCLLNKETLTNDYTEERKQLKKLIETYGNVKELGRPFLRAANPSPVEVILVTLQDTRQKETFRLDFDPATIGKNGYTPDSLPENELVSADLFESYEARHRAAIEAFKELLAAKQKVAYYLKGIIEGVYKDPKDIMAEAIKKGSSDLAYTEFLDTTTKLAWDNMFRQTKLANVTTENVRKEIEKMQASQGTMSFTAANMQDLFDMLNLNKEHIMIQCVLEAFDTLTKHYHENREAVEGWKTNAAYLVGRKFILPYMGNTWGEGLSYDRVRDIDDLEKALCFVSGRKFEGIYHVRDVYNHKSHYGKWMDSQFFETILYKKGTMHFRWNDEKLRQDFNALVARHRWGRMPEKVKTGAYK